MTAHTPQPAHSPRAAAAVAGFVLLADADGTVRPCTGDGDILPPGLDALPGHLSGLPGLGCRDLAELLRRYPPGRVHAAGLGRPARAYDLRTVVHHEEGDGARGVMLIFQETLRERFRAENLRNASVRATSLMQGVFDAAPTPTLLVERGGRVIAANAAAQGLLEAPETDLAHMALADLSANGSAESLRAWLEALRHGEAEVDPLDLDCRTPGGRDFPARLVGRRVSLEDEVVLDVLLLDRTPELERRRELDERDGHVDELKTTVKHLIDSVEEHKEEHREELASTVQRQVLPLLDKMVGESDQERRRELQRLIADTLRETAGRASDLPDPYLMDLTPTEMEVCEYIQLGRGTKEIAEVMHTSFETVQTHRKNIRRKLGLKGRKVTLFAFLKGRED